MSLAPPTQLLCTQPHPPAHLLYTYVVAQFIVAVFVSVSKCYVVIVIV